MRREVIERLKERYRLAVHLSREIKGELGEERAEGILKRAFASYHAELMEEYGRDVGERSLGNLARNVKEASGPLGIIEMEVLEESPRRFAIKITRCRHLEALGELGAPELCPALCASDWEATRAYNPEIEFTRSRAIALRDPFCDHAWELKG